MSAVFWIEFMMWLLLVPTGWGNGNFSSHLWRQRRWLRWTRNSRSRRSTNLSHCLSVCLSVCVCMDI